MICIALVVSRKSLLLLPTIPRACDVTADPYDCNLAWLVLPSYEHSSRSDNIGELLVHAGFKDARAALTLRQQRLINIIGYRIGP